MLTKAKSNCLGEALKAKLDRRSQVIASEARQSSINILLSADLAHEIDKVFISQAERE